MTSSSSTTSLLPSASSPETTSIAYSDAQHGGALLEKLRRQRVTGRYCDVLVIVGERHYAAHRTVLAAASPYFDNIFRHNKVVKEHLTVNCTNTAHFDLLLNYIYSGSVTVDQRNVIDLLKLASNFLVTKLKYYCAEYLHRHLDASTCLTVKELSQRFNMPELGKIADNYLLLNPNECVEQAVDLERYPLSKIAEFIADHTLRLRGDVQMSLVLRWIKHDVGERHSKFKTLLPSMRLADMSSESLATLVDEHPAFSLYGDNRLALFTALNDDNLLVPAKHAADYEALMQGKSNGVRHVATLDPKVIGDRLLAPGEKLDYIPIVPKHLRDDPDDDQTPSPGVERVPLKLSIKLPPPSDVSSPPKRAYTKRKAGEGGVKRGRPSKARMEADARLAAEHEVAEMTLAASLGDDDDEFAMLTDDAEVFKDEFSDVDDVGDVPMKSGTTDDENTVLFKCKTCMYMTRDEERMAAHTQTAHLFCPRIFVCDMCEEGWETEWNHEYYQHMEKVHYTSGPPFQCDLCPHTAIKVQHIMSHRLEHTQHKAYKCAYAECTYSCRLKSSLVIHQRQHTGERPFKCTTCHRSFAMSRTLETHAYTHSDDRPFVCEECPFSTKYQTHLISHRRIHTGDVFHCTYTDCAYNSPKKSQLAAHLRTVSARIRRRTRAQHLAVREHTCRTCSRSFIEKSHLVRHERIHLIEKPFKCDNCDYASSRRDKLKEHILKHHGSQSTLRQKQRKYRRQRHLDGLVAKKDVMNEENTFRPISHASSFDDDDSHEAGVTRLFDAPTTPTRANVAPTHPTDALLGRFAPLATPSPSAMTMQRPSSASVAGVHREFEHASPAMSLNLALGHGEFGTPTHMGALGGQVRTRACSWIQGDDQLATPTLITPTPASSTTNHAHVDLRPVSMPELADKAPQQQWPSTSQQPTPSDYTLPNNLF